MIAKVFAVLLFLLLIDCTGKGDIRYERESANLLKKDIIRMADKYLQENPQTVTMFVCDRSAGGIHDFYSEGDYWWPDPDNAEGPYLQRDGMTNPENFVEHRRAMIRLSTIVGTLASAYKITGDEKYVEHAYVHLNAWFADPATRMNPSLLYSQAIKGRFTGRGIGIIDTIHLIEVAQAIIVMNDADCIEDQMHEAVKTWFEEYLQWLTTHKYGQDEMNADNNHGTCWVMQVAAFARLTRNETILELCRDRYKTVLLPGQMAADGSFPLEISRTKPYGYSLFNLDALTMVCLILSDEKNDLWNYSTGEGKSLNKGIEYMYPFVKDKKLWPHKNDVMYWDEWPVAHPFLVFGAARYNKPEWFETWASLKHYPEVEEVIRNLPVRNPVIWFD